jgi:hypothetical protein
MKEKGYSEILNDYILKNEIVLASIKHEKFVKIGEGNKTSQDLSVPLVYVFYKKPPGKIKIISITERLEGIGFKTGKPFDTLYSQKNFKNYIKNYGIKFCETKNLNDFLKELRIQ